MNPLCLILLVGGGALYFSKLSNAAKRISITILNIDTFKIVGGALQLSVNIALDNPSDINIILKKPNVKAFYKENEVGNSIPSEEKISVKANARTVMKQINIQIPFSKMPNVVMSLFPVTTGKKNLAFGIEVSTKVNGIVITEKKTLSI